MGPQAKTPFLLGRAAMDWMNPVGTTIVVGASPRRRAGYRPEVMLSAASKRICWRERGRSPLHICLKEYEYP
jgi:hypothetical protein